MFCFFCLMTILLKAHKKYTCIKLNIQNKTVTHTPAIHSRYVAMRLVNSNMYCTEEFFWWSVVKYSVMTLAQITHLICFLGKHCLFYCFNQRSEDWKFASWWQQPYENNWWEAMKLHDCFDKIVQKNKFSFFNLISEYTTVAIIWRAILN